MSDKTKNLIRQIYSIVLSVMTAVAGLLLIIQSQRIYRRDLLETERPYSREVVAEYLGQIAPVLYVWIALVVIGYILWQVFPPENKRLKATIYKTDIAKRMRAPLPTELVSDKLQKIELINKIVRGITALFGVVATIMVSICILNGENYSHPGQSFDPMNDFLIMLPQFMPWVAAFFILAVATSIYSEISAKKEIEEIKRIHKENKGFTPALIGGKEKRSFIQIPEKFKTEKFKKGVTLGFRIGLPVIGVTLFIIGLFNGGVEEVFEKAINICTECIGLG